MGFILYPKLSLKNKTSQWFTANCASAASLKQSAYQAPFPKGSERQISEKVFNNAIKPCNSLPMCYMLSRIGHIGVRLASGPSESQVIWSFAKSFE